MVKNKTTQKRTRIPLEDRFWKYVDKTTNITNCWNWHGHVNKYGYGTIWHPDHGPLRANRVTYVLMYGDIPNQLHVLHKCDNRACCNPHHLFLGTRQDNVIDMVQKDRQAKGMRIHLTKLTEIQVLAIRKEYTQLYTSYRQLAKRYHVDPRTIAHICNRKTWKHI